jgi:serine phosphatase RsbU (regulator of sigma subunit)
VSTLHLQIERPGHAPVERDCEGDAVVIGRTGKADIAIDDHSVSRRHARLFRDGAAWFIEDLGSRNGTLLNGKALSDPAEARPGDTIRIGDTQLRVRSVGKAEREFASPPPITDAPADNAYFSVLRPVAELIQTTDADVGASSRLQLLNEVHRVLSGPISRDELLQMILDRAFAVLQPEQAAIFLKGPDGELVRAAERRSPGSSGSLLVSRRLAEEVTVKGAAALVLDAQADERFASAKSVLVSGVRSIVAAPLSDSAGCLGMIALYSSIHVRRFSEQDLQLLASLASVAAMRVRNIALAEAAAARQVIDRELALAREIQMGMLRRRPPTRDEVDLGARLTPARTVGGDFYDFLLDGDSLWFIVADVSGKGMAAAMMMAVGQTLFRAIAGAGLSLDEAMARMNRELSRDNDGAMFVTAFGGRLDLTTGRMELANAGHNLPYCLRADGTVELVKAKNSLAFGVLEEASFPITELSLEPDEALLLYTDGVCDAVDALGASFDTERIEQFLSAYHSLRPADALVQGLFDAVDTFAGDAPQEDDITVAVIRYRGQRAPTTQIGRATVAD